MTSVNSSEISIEHTDTVKTFMLEKPQKNKLYGWLKIESFPHLVKSLQILGLLKVHENSNIYHNLSICRRKFDVRNVKPGKTKVLLFCIIFTKPFFLFHQVLY